MPGRSRDLVERIDVFSRNVVDAMAIYMDPYSSLQDLTNAVETMENVLRVRRRVFGDCPRTTSDTWKTEAARAILAERTSERRETPS